MRFSTAARNSRPVNSTVHQTSPLSHYDSKRIVSTWSSHHSTLFDIARIARLSFFFFFFLSFFLSFLVTLSFVSFFLCTLPTCLPAFLVFFPIRHTREIFGTFILSFSTLPVGYLCRRPQAFSSQLRSPAFILFGLALSAMTWGTSRAPAKDDR